MIALFYFVCSCFININWINDIACSLGYFLAIYLVLFIALIPGFNYIFMFISLLWDKKEKKKCIRVEEDVTVLIPVYNAKNTIKETIESIRNQKYCGNIYINVIDDGSTDGSLEVLQSMNLDCNITLLESAHMGKASALNKGLQHVKTDYTITVDSDTVLHPLTIRKIMHKLINSNEKTAATAGCIFVKNSKKSFITKLQEWDYTLGIFGVKLYQCIFPFYRPCSSYFRATWTNIIGLWKSVINWLDDFICYFLGMLLCLVIEIKRKNMLREIECKLERRSILAFIVYVLLYAFILAPFCLIGYISELINFKKKW